MDEPIVPDSQTGSTKEVKTPRLLEFRSSTIVVIITVCAATFTDGFNYAVIVPVLPFALRDRYHVPQSQVQFWTSMLLGIFGGFVLLGSPLIGWVVDGSGSRKPAFTFGLLSLIGGVALQVITTHIWVLILSRILQGIASAVVYTVGLTLISDTVPSQDIGYYFGFAISAMSFGILVGPCVGGLAFDIGGYYAVVGTMGIVALIDTVFRLLMIERSEAQSFVTVDREATERTALLPSRAEIPFSEADYSPLTRTAGFQTFALLANPQIAAAIYGVFVQTSLCAAFDGVLTLFLEEIFGWRGLNVALCFLTMSAPLTTMGPLFGKLSDTYGPRWIAVSGFILNSVPMVLLQLIKRNESSQIWQLLALLVLSGTTLSMIISPLAADISRVLEQKEKNEDGRAAYAQSYGLFNCAMAAATLVGPVVGGWLKARYGWTVLCWTLGVFSLSGAVPSYFYTGRNV